MNAEQAGGATPPAQPAKPDDLTSVVLRMDRRQQQHGEILFEILKLLRPSDDKPGASDLVKELISRIDRQTAMLRSLLVAINEIGKNLPELVVRILHETENDANGELMPKAPLAPGGSNGNRPS